MPAPSAASGRPAVASAAGPTDCGPTSLAALPRGCLAAVTGFRADADPATVRRLVDLGFVPGAQVELIRRAPLGDPAIFAIAGYEIALRRTLARLINVTVAE